MKGNGMNETYKRIPTRFGPDTRFEVTPAAAPHRAVQAAELERLKDRLLQEQLPDTARPELEARVRQAASEAAALAWVTTVPLLVFPALFDEKIQAALLQARRQELIFERSRELLAA